MNTTIQATVQSEQDQQPEPIRLIRKIGGTYHWVTLTSEAEMTEDERRERYCHAFGIYA